MTEHKAIGSRIAGAVLAALAVWVYFESATIVTGFKEVVGPGEFPKLISIPMAILGIGLIFFPEDKKESWPSKFVVVKQTLLILLLVFFAMGVKPLGFLPCAAFTGIFIMKLFSAKWNQAIIFGLILSVSLLFLFEFALGIHLPNIPGLSF